VYECECMSVSMSESVSEWASVVTVSAWSNGKSYIRGQDFTVCEQWTRLYWDIRLQSR
jgi:hypothetical protein